MKKIIYFKEIGITMVALVISIIIILILSGVTLSTVTGENGLISKAKLAVEKYKESQMTEEESLKNLEENFKNFNFIESNKDVTEKETTTAQKEDVLEGKSYYTNEDELITGTMPKIESKNIELKSGDEYTIPLGYKCY